MKGKQLWHPLWIRVTLLHTFSEHNNQKRNFHSTVIITGMNSKELFLNRGGAKHESVIMRESIKRAVIKMKEVAFKLYMILHTTMTEGEKGGGFDFTKMFPLDRNLCDPTR